MNNLEYVRVTEVLYPFSGLMKIDPAILKNAADRGTLVHQICDALIWGIPIPQEIQEQISGNELIAWYTESFNKWYTDKQFFEKPERFYCDKYMITGECDGIYQDGDALVLVDFKTPIKESHTWKLQASAYYYLAKKKGYDIKRIEFVKLSREGKEPTVFVYEPDFDMFLHHLEAYRYSFHKIKQPEDLDFI